MLSLLSDGYVNVTQNYSCKNRIMFEFGIFCVGPCSIVVGNQRFEGLAASIIRVEVRVQGDVKMLWLHFLDHALQP